MLPKCSNKTLLIILLFDTTSVIQDEHPSFEYVSFVSKGILMLNMTTDGVELLVSWLMTDLAKRHLR